MYLYSTVPFATSRCATVDLLCLRVESRAGYHASYASLWPSGRLQLTKTDCLMKYFFFEPLAETNYLEYLVSKSYWELSSSLIEKSYHYCWHPLLSSLTPVNSTHIRSQTIETWSDLSNLRCLTINFAWPLSNWRTSASYWTSFGSCQKAATSRSIIYSHTIRSHLNYIGQTSCYHNCYSPNLNYWKFVCLFWLSEASSNWH